MPNHIHHSPKKVAVIGATGLIGSHLLGQMLQDSFFEKIQVITRRPTGKTGAQMQEFIVPLDQQAGLSAQMDCQDAYCCLGTTMKQAGSKDAFYQVDFTFVESFAQLTLAAGATRFFLVTAMGANPTSLIYYNRVKGDIEERIKRMGFDQVHIFRPSLLLGERGEKRLGEDVGKVINKILSPIMPESIKGIEGADVARAMVQAAKITPAGMGNFVYPSDVIRKMAQESV